MPDLPIRRMVLYKHGVGFFERYGQVGDAAQVELVFKKDEMNDVLKSLAAFPQGDGQVINISYATPEDKQSALENAPILLSQNAALLDLLRSLRGRQVCLHLVEVSCSLQAGGIVESTVGEEFQVNGTLLGVDVKSSIEKTRVSVLSIEKTRVSVLTAGNTPGDVPTLRTFAYPSCAAWMYSIPRVGTTCATFWNSAAAAAINAVSQS